MKLLEEHFVDSSMRVPSFQNDVEKN